MLLLFMLEQCLTHSSPGFGERLSEHAADTQLGRHKTHPTNSTETDIALDLLRTSQVWTGHRVNRSSF